MQGTERKWKKWAERNNANESKRDKERKRKNENRRGRERVRESMCVIDRYIDRGSEIVPHMRDVLKK